MFLRIGEDMGEPKKDLKKKLRNIPELPGIYKMLDSHGNIIYVGKSKCLKRRVRSYFTKDHKWEKINKLVALIHDIDFTVTDTHLEARLLECELIKTIKPFFNSQMKNDRNYVYLQVKEYNKFNALAVENERMENSFGPFRNRYKLILMIDLLNNLYPISFDGSNFNFEHNIFPLIMDRDTFDDNKRILLSLFTDDFNLALFISQLEEKMKEAANNYKYELASLYRDMINCLEYVRYGINGYKELFSKRLVLKIQITDGIKLFYVNKGKILLTKKYKRLSQLNKYIDIFIEKGNAIRYKNPIEQDDKVAIDYRDILYSEINGFTEDMIISIDD
ncbi:MAG: hypothetical protein EWM50_07465 [Gottschalkiaceae bacterium]|nr:MAG: hypothetical protein EWM50_07465 [Gottschalkiaceae bacterium]